MDIYKVIRHVLQWLWRIRVTNFQIFMNIIGKGKQTMGWD